MKMKSSMKKAGIFLLLGILFVGVMPAKSQGNLYVYGNDASKKAYPLEQLSQLTFTETELVIHTLSGNPESVLFEDLRLFSLGNYNLGLVPVLTKAVEVNVYPNPVVTDVTVKNDGVITHLNLYNLQGQNLLQLYPEKSEVTIPLTNYPAGIYLLYVTDKNGPTVKKIIKN
jgi:hypothetical protein